MDLYSIQSGLFFQMICAASETAHKLQTSCASGLTPELDSAFWIKQKKLTKAKNKIN